MFDLAWWIIAALLIVGCVVQTALGFGFALLAAPVAVLLRPEWMPVLLTVVGLVLSSLNLWNLRTRVRWRTMVWPLLARVPGTVVGAWVLTEVSTGVLQLMIAGMVLVAVLMSRFGKTFEATPLRLGLAGFASGVAGTTTAIGGPPMVIVMQHGAPDTVRANLAGFFAVSSVFSLVSYVAIGRLDATMAWVSLTFVPVVLAGFWLGRPLGRRIGDRFRPLVLAVCVVSALIALGGALIRL